MRWVHLAIKLQIYTSDSSSDSSDSNSPHGARSMSSSSITIGTSCGCVPNTSPYNGLPFSSTGGFPQPPAWYPKEAPCKGNRYFHYT